MHGIFATVAGVVGFLNISPAKGQQLDFSGPFGRTVNPASAFRLDQQARHDDEGAADTAEIRAAAVLPPQVQFLAVPTLISTADAKIYVLAAGAAFGSNQVLFRYANLDLDGGDEIDQYFAQFKFTVTRNIGVFGFATRTEGLSRDYGAAGSLQLPMSDSFALAANLGYQLHQIDLGADQDDLFARAGSLWQPLKWLQVAVDHELKNDINGTDTSSIEVTVADKFFVGADTEDSIWAGVAFAF